MSSAAALRRRAHGPPTPQSAESESSAVTESGETTQVGEEDDSGGGLGGDGGEQPVKVIYRKASPRRMHKRAHTAIFFLGSLFGIIAAGFFAKRNDLIAFPEFGELSMESFFEALPVSLVSDMRDLVKGERDFLDSYDAFSVGLKARADGLEAKHPVIMIPGVISTGLESWGTGNLSRPYFRKRLWGSWSMMRALIMDKETWKKHIMLDRETGLDPPGIKLRAAQGFDATDFFITGYWIWNKIFENLASLGYDPTNSFTAAYDWRLSYANLEVRDQYFSRLKAYVELAHAFSGHKVVLASHSMGSQVLFYFLHWVASPQGGDGGDDWVERHVDSWINISGCMLGALKDLTAVLSGEMRDTAQLNSFAVYGLERFLSRDERAEMFRAMPGISSMLPIGGNAVWGDLDGAPDDQPGQKTTFGGFINFRGAEANWTVPERNFTVEDATDFLFKTTESWYGKLVNDAYSRGVAKTKAVVDANELDPRKWINPLESRLPLAPSLKIYCFYGVGKPTERAYFYRSPETLAAAAKASSASSTTTALDDENVKQEAMEGLIWSPELNITMDTGLIHGVVDHGVIMGEGDGTVNLMSTGYMCNKGWHLSRYNPAGIEIKVVEMPHEPERFNPRGGPNTADHVDILGRQNLNELILRVAAGKGDDIEDYVVSNIKEYANKVMIWEEGQEPSEEELRELRRRSKEKTPPARSDPEIEA